MARIDFTGLIQDRYLGEFRRKALEEIAPWIADPPVNYSANLQAGHERGRTAVERHREQIEDLLVAVQGVEGLNREIESILQSGWPQWAQGIVSGEVAARVRGVLERSRAARDELEDIAIQLAEGMDVEAALGASPEHRQSSESSPDAKSRTVPLRSEQHVPSISGPTRAIVHINGFDKIGTRQSAQLKRLALFFDEIHYVLPEFWVIRDEVLADPQRVAKEPNDLIRIIGGVDPVRDLWPAIPLPFSQLAGDLQNTISVLSENGIAVEYDANRLKGVGQDHVFDRIKHRLAWEDARDPVFAHLSGTVESDYQTEYVPATVQLYETPPTGPSLEGGITKTIYLVFPPVAILDSVDISTVLYAAHLTSACPVFLSSRQRAEVAHRYQRYQAGLHVLKEYAPDVVSPDDFKTRFGEVTFTLANGVISSEILASKTVEDIVKYRSSIDDARRRFISEHIVEATALVQENPWGRHTRDELEQFVRGKLSSDVLRYQEESKAGWERLFGTASESFAEITKFALFGGSAGMVGQFGGVVGNLVPKVSTWDMLLIGALGGAAQQTPRFVRSIVDTVAARRQQRRSAIAYVAEFR